MFGKWNLGDKYLYRYEDRGFHEVVCHGGGGITQGPDYWWNDSFDATSWHNSQLEQYKGYCTDVFCSEATDFIEDNKENSFFCYISTNAPHKLWNVLENDLNPARKYDMEVQLLDQDGKIHPAYYVYIEKM